MRKSQSKNWRKVKLGEVMSTAKTNFEKIKTSEYRKTGKFPIYDQGSDNIAGYTDNPKAEYKGKSPAILFGDHTLKLKLAEPPFAIGADGIQILEPDENLLDRKFFYYTIKGLKIKSYGYERHMKYLRELEILYPSIIDQKYIASILSAFDDKIELNNKISRNLEQMAQAIFKEWFVKFKFPGYKKVKMVDSELGKIPVELGFTNFVGVLVENKGKGFEPGSVNYSSIRKDGFIPFYRVRDLGTQKRKTDVYVNKNLVKDDYICKVENVLISLDGTVGKVAIGCVGAYSSGIYKIHPNINYDYIKNSFLYFFLKSNYVQNILNSYVKGTTITHASYALDYIYIPTNRYYIEEFQNIAEPIFTNILKNIEENQKLAALRDLLLPKLMNGEIKV